MEKMVKESLVNSNFWLGKKVLVTGHTGFKGGWLSLWLSQLGADVVGYSLAPNSNNCLFEKASVGQHIESVFGDILDLTRLKSIFKQFQPEIVFHLAAQSLVHYSYQNPIETYKTNVIGTLNVLEAIRSTDSVRSAVMVTSDKCYENKEWVWGYRENDSMGGHDPYSSSKGCAELLISSYRRSYFSSESITKHAALASARAGNVIGGGDWAKNRLVPDFVRAIKAGEAASIRNPHAIRPWQHVLEPLSGYIALADALYKQPEVFSEAWNFSSLPMNAKPVEWVVKALVECWGDGATWRNENSETYLHEAEYLKLDCTKSYSKLGWEPKWTLSMALEKTVEWYKCADSGEDPFELCDRQIKEYMKV